MITPLFIGFIWYTPKVFGNAWRKECGFTLESMGKPKPLIFLYIYLLSFLLSVILSPFVIHQFGFFSTLMSDPSLMEPGSDLNIYAADFMAKYSSNFRTFKHSAFHDALMSLFIVLPVMGTAAFYEKNLLNM